MSEIRFFPVGLTIGAAPNRPHHVVCIVAAILALIGSPVPQGHLKRFIDAPTGTNGYEDYLAAADVADSQTMRAFTAWETEFWDRRMHPRDSAPNDHTPEGLSWSSSALDLARARALREQAIVGLLHSGGEKLQFDQGTGPDADPKALAALRQVAKDAAMIAYAEFADGNGAKATSILLDVYTMARRISRKDVLHNYFGDATSSIALAGFSESLSRLALSDWQKIERYAASALKDRMPELDSLTGDRTTLEARIRDSLASPDFLDDEKLTAQIRALPKAQTEEMVYRAKNIAEQTADLIAKRLDMPESSWIQDLPPELKRPATLPPNPTPDEIAEYIGRSCYFPDQYFNAIAKRRTQLRLLYLHAKIEEHLWEQRQLPKTLASVAAGAAIDPYTGAPFEYEVKTDRTYVLRGLGVPSMGPLALRYQRSPGSKLPGDDDPIPPLLRR